MQCFIIAGIVLSFAALPALAQTGGTSGSGSSGSDARVTAPVGFTSTIAPSSPAASGSVGSTAAPAGTMGAVTTEAQARSRLESSGYSNVIGLIKGNGGLWRPAPAAMRVLAAGQLSHLAADPPRLSCDLPATLDLLD